jgi:hypothetical protein
MGSKGMGVLTRSRVRFACSLTNGCAIGGIRDEADIMILEVVSEGDGETEKLNIKESYTSRGLRRRSGGCGEAESSGFCLGPIVSLFGMDFV